MLTPASSCGRGSRVFAGVVNAVGIRSVSRDTPLHVGRNPRHLAMRSYDVGTSQHIPGQFGLFRLWIQHDAWNALEMTQIARHEYQVMMQRRGGNQHVHILDELPATPEMTPD